MRRAGGGLLVAIVLCGAGVSAAQDQPSCSWVPFDASTPDSILNEVDVVDPTSAWAVGYRRAEGRELTLVRRWDGTSWETQPSRNSKAPVNQLADVVVAADGTVWTVGQRKARGGVKTMAQRYDGESWRMQATLDPGESVSRFEGVDVTPGGTVYAVGSRQDPAKPLRSMIQRRDGGGWELMAPPRGKELNDVAAIDDDDVWAVGQRVTRSGGVRAQVVHFDGRSWTEVAVPAIAKTGRLLHAIDASSPDDVWAAGLYAPSGESEPLMLHFDGSSWSVVELPPLEEEWLVLVDVAAIDRDTAAAVGYGYSTEAQRETQAVLEWDGETWRRTHPDEERGPVDLNGIDLAADGGGWTVGWMASESFGKPLSYVERRTCE